MRRLMIVVIACLSAIALTTGVVAAQWPTTCVELNDIVEAHLGNVGNVGIYQRVFGDQAEQACQNDHRNDVRSVFAWAIGEPEPAMGPARASGSTSCGPSGSGSHQLADANTGRSDHWCSDACRL